MSESDAASVRDRRPRQWGYGALACALLCLQCVQPSSSSSSPRTAVASDSTPTLVSPDLPSASPSPLPVSTTAPNVVAVEGYCSLTISSVAGLAFAHIFRADWYADSQPWTRQQLLRFGRSGVHLEHAILNGLPHQDGWIDGAVGIRGHWPTTRLRITQRRPAPPMSQAVFDTSTSTYQWSSGAWRVGPAQHHPADGKYFYREVAKACADQRYNGLVRVDRLELPTGEVFITGNCQRLQSKAPSRPPRVVAAMWDREQNLVQTWTLPETSQLDAYVQARVHGVSSSQMYVSIDDRRGTLAPGQFSV